MSWIMTIAVTADMAAEGFCPAGVYDLDQAQDNRLAMHHENCLYRGAAGRRGSLKSFRGSRRWTACDTTACDRTFSR